MNPTPSASAAKSASATQIDAEPDHDDFWGTGASVEIDEDGHLLYASQVELVAGGGINVQTAPQRHGFTDPNAIYVDPLTGRPVILHGGSSTRRSVPHTVVVPPSQSTTSNAPRVGDRRPASRRMDSGIMRRGTATPTRQER